MSAPVLVLGGRGQLGSAMVRAFAGDEVLAPARDVLDVTDARAVAAYVGGSHPRLIVNCAAWNDVDGAEAAPLDVLEANAFAVRHLARAAEEAGAVLIHYGSDFVFDGAAAEPYRETDAPNPRGTYAASKLLGEWFALESPGAFVLRVESLFGVPPGAGGRRGSLDTILDRLRAGDEVPVFADRTVSPSHVDDVVAATRALVSRGAPAGLYHCVNTGQATWDEVAVEAARLLGVEPRLRRISLDSVSLKAPRPRFCALSNAKLVAAGVAMPTWQDALTRTVAAARPHGSTAGV